MPRRTAVGVETRNPPLSTPTTARPGTAEKLAVLCLRAALGHHLFHPLDGLNGSDLVRAIVKLNRAHHARPFREPI